MNQIRVRMYRQEGIGDCFLLSFPKSEGMAHMLIDGGVLKGTEDGKARMQAIVRDIAKTTACLEPPGSHLDVLVVTHEHWDHVSGFLQAENEFKQLSIGEVWLAWTEKTGDALADQLREQRAKARKTVDAARQKLQISAIPAATTVLKALNNLSLFDGDLDVAGGNSTAAAMTWVREKTGAPVCFLNPGEEPRTIPGIDGVRAFVLGPPKDTTLLKQSDPSKQTPEVYQLARETDLGFSAALLDECLFSIGLNFVDELDKGGPLSPALRNEFRQEILIAEVTVTVQEAGRKWAIIDPGKEYHILRENGKLNVYAKGVDAGRPFDASFEVPIAKAKDDSFFRKFYYSADEWRQIELDWLGTAERLALQLDSDTNNTSLALAIELVDNGHVLLFPGDAQVGNWRSWEPLEWTVKDRNGEPMKVKSKDLLARTVLYKVGHHASHNATLRENGLELMQSPELAAMIPVDEEQAHAQGKGGWEMPFGPLLKRIQEKTLGRVIRADTGVPDTWPAGMVARPVANDLYIDYMIEL